MTRDEAIPMLCVACGVSPASADINVTALHLIVDKLIAAEREACALIADEEFGSTLMIGDAHPKHSSAWRIAAAIRTRKAS
jgi:hypothetical protein